MKMQQREELVNRIWGENAGEILEFLKKVAPEKISFRDKNSLLNHMGRWLEKEINKFSRHVPEPWLGFWENRVQSVRYEWPHSNRPKNMLYVIRLLNGKISLPVSKED